MNIWASFAWHISFFWHATGFVEKLWEGKMSEESGVWARHCDSIASSQRPSKCKRRQSNKNSQIEKYILNHCACLFFFVWGGVFTFRGPCALTCPAHRPWPRGRCKGAQRNTVGELFGSAQGHSTSDSSILSHWDQVTLWVVAKTLFSNWSI